VLFEYSKKVLLNLSVSLIFEQPGEIFGLGLFSLKQGDNVEVFLLGKGVEAEQLDTEKFSVSEQMAAFADAGGGLLACGTCIRLRKGEGETACPLSDMSNLHRMIVECDKVISF
jgi:sulfur relay (sulfurtransferase) complex TusBCD TusD component (DsrE family)